MRPGVRRLTRPVVDQALPTVTARSACPRGLRVGLLGGSFNPAHEGHRLISLEALRRLGLDQVWWLVAPQNPLKPPAETAPLVLRLARAREIAAHPRIHVSDFEARSGTTYTLATVARLRVQFPNHRFVWLMGADNLRGLARWYRWADLVAAVPIAVFDRESYVYEALAERAATRFAHARWPMEKSGSLVDAAPPAWCLLRLRTHPAASSAIRAAGRWRSERRTEED